MNRMNDLRTLQQLTEDAAVDARKLMLLANSLKPDDLQQQLEELCSGFEDAALQARRLCERQMPGTGGYRRGKSMRPLEVVGSVERIGIDWLHIRINTLLPHCRFQPPTWLTETLVELLDAYEACGGQLPHFKSALLVIEEYSDVDGRHIFDQDNKGWKAVSNAIKGRVIPDDDQYTLSVALLSTRSCQNVCHITVLDMKDAPDFFSARAGDYSVTLSFNIIKVDRENGFALASRKSAMKARRSYFAHRAELNAPGTRLKCRVIDVGPVRCTVECYGHDIRLTQKDLCYMVVSDLRAVYRPGQELDCVVTDYDADADRLRVSVKAALSDPFEGAERRHPVNSRRQAVISGKYAGGVFCNLPDGSVCMCSYAYQYEDSDFEIGDTVILTVKRFDSSKRQIYGKILSKW